MSRFADALFAHLGRHPRAWLSVLLAAILAGAPGAARLGVDNSVDVWTLPGSRATAAHQHWRAVFGDDDWLVVGFRPGQPALSAAGLAEVRRVTEALQGLPGAGQVLSLWSYFRDSRGVGPGERPTEADVAAFRAEVEASPFFENDLLRRSTGAAGIYIELAGRKPIELERLGIALDRLVESERAAGVHLHWGGVAAISYALDAASRREIATRLPAGVVVAGALVWLSGMPLGALLLVMALAGLATLASLGALAASGHSLNIVLTILPSLVFFVSLTYGVFVAHALAGAGLAGPLSVRLRRIFVPVFDSMATTLAGLLALELSAFPVLHRLGRFGALGVAVGMILPFLVMPLVLPEGVRCDRGPQRGWSRLDPRRVLGFWLVLAILAFPGVGLIRSEMDPLAFLPPTHPVRESFRWIARELTGLSPLEVVLRFPTPVTDPKSFRALDTLSSRLREMEGVSRVLSAADWLRRFEQNRSEGESPDPAAYRIPADEARIREYLSSDEGDRFLRRFVTRDLTTWHVHVRTTVEPALAFAQLKQRVIAEVRAAFPAAEVEVYGQHALIKEMEGYLVSSTVWSLGVAWLIIAAILIARAPSLTIGLHATVPNTLPILFVLAAMGYAGIPLDVGTTMVTTVATGLSADNTFHFLERWRTACAGGATVEDAVRETLDHAAAPMIQSALLTGTLFSVLATSSFAPVAWFGALNALSIFSSLFLDLTYLPAWLRRHGAPR